MTTPFKALAVALTLAAGSAQAATVNLVSNGGFELPNIPTNSISQFVNLNPNAEFGWITGTNGVELRDHRNFPAGFMHEAAEGAQYVELAVERNSHIFQDIFLTQGQEYTLTFAYSPRAPFGSSENQATVSFAGWASNLVADASSQQPGAAPINMWRYVTQVFIGTGKVEQLRFAATGTNGSYGMFFDDVALTATPLPAAALFFATSMAGFFAARRRKSPVAA